MKKNYNTIQKRLMKNVADKLTELFK